MPTDLPLHADDVPEQAWDLGEIRARRRRLGAAAGAVRLGVAIIDIPPGHRPNPPHNHADEEEIFLVLGGSGLSYQTTGSADVRTYRVGVDDVIVHPAGSAAHTLVAGADGLRVFVVAEGSRSRITYLPRTRQFWLGPRWSPADSPPPFVADSELGPLELPPPSEERPPTIRNLAELPLHEGRDGERLAFATRGAGDCGAERLVLAHDAMPPDTHTTELHFHTAREEGWYVLGGSGTARLDDAAHPLRPGSFWLARPGGPEGHRVEVGPEGMQLLTFGDLVAGDACVYPEKGTVKVAHGVELPYRT